MHLQSYAQQNPDHIFAKQARDAFDAFVLDYETRVAVLLTANWARNLTEVSGPFDEQSPAKPLSRLAPCPCGSGRRFKHCLGPLSGWPRSQLPAPG
jgi:uncharacterized protein YecA (UPF0149 family)